MQLYILPGLVIAMLSGLTVLLLRSRDLERRPVMFAQATVVALARDRARFELFDGQILDLALRRDAALHVGDYGRLTYRAGQFVSLER